MLKMKVLIWEYTISVDGGSWWVYQRWYHLHNTSVCNLLIINMEINVCGKPHICLNPSSLNSRYQITSC